MIKFLINVRDVFFGVLNDIKNYLVILWIIKKHKNTEEWKRLNLRVDWIGRVYTVVNIKKEDYNDIEEIKMIRFVEAIEPISDYLMLVNLSEILAPVRVDIPGTYSILLKLVPRMVYLNVRNIFSFLLKLGFVGLVLYIISLYVNFAYFYDLFIEYLKGTGVLK